MKKFRLFFFLTLLSSVFLLSDCKKSDADDIINGDNCEALLEDLTEASEDFTSNMSEATCNDYFDAIEDYFDGCNDVPQSEKDEYEAWIESFDCSILATD